MAGSPFNSLHRRGDKALPEVISSLSQMAIEATILVLISRGDQATGRVMIDRKGFRSRTFIQTALVSLSMERAVELGIILTGVLFMEGRTLAMAMVREQVVAIISVEILESLRKGDDLIR